MQMHRARQLDQRQSSFCYEERVLDRDHRRSPPSTLAGGAIFIEHHVSKLDTLAGIAIKYGVEIADIKKMNGLATDIQIFALRSIQIPLPGRHPPSPCSSLSDASTPVLSPSSSSQKTSFDWSSDFLDSFQSSRPRASTHKASAAMSSLQSYYCLQSDHGQKVVIANGCPPRKSKSIANGFLDDPAEADQAVEGEAIDKLQVRRRQKSEADVTSRNSTSCTAPELLLREDNTTTGGAFSAITGKCLALRSNTKGSSSNQTPMISSLANDHVQTDHHEMSGSDIRKCPSISSFQDQGSTNSLASLWGASKWPDLQVLTTAAITRPIFDGIQKPVTIWRNKTAVD